MGRILSYTLSFSNSTLDARATTSMAPTAACNLTTQACVEEARKSGNFNPTLAVVVSAMIISFFAIGFASGFLRRWIWGYDDEVRHSELMRRRRLHSLRALRTQTSSKPQRGLDPEIVAAMPLILHKDLPTDEQEGKDFDCPVCLAVFDATDSLKLLPQCSHAFHSDCIDEWFRFHSTCPICRLSLAPSVGKSRTRGDAGGGRPLSEDVANPSGIHLPADFDVVDIDGATAILRHEAQEIPTVNAPTAGEDEQEEREEQGVQVNPHPIIRSNSEQGVQVNPHPIICSNSQGFSSFVPAIRVEIESAKAELASIRRSSSVGTDLQFRRHTGYVVDSEGTQHHQNFQVHSIDIDGRSGDGSPVPKPVSLWEPFSVASGSMSSKSTGLPCVWCTRRSFPNLRQIGPVWKSSLEGAGSGNS